MAQMTPGQRLRQAREAAGYTSAAKAAKALGLGASTYAAHENGQNAFTAQHAERYAEAFGIDAAWLLFGEADAAEMAMGAVSLSSSAILAALVQSLQAKGVLSDDETVEVYESALMLLELQQAQADISPAYGHIVALARELIEEHLRP